MFQIFLRFSFLFKVRSVIITECVRIMPCYCVSTIQLYLKPARYRYPAVQLPLNCIEIVGNMKIVVY